MEKTTEVSKNTVIKRLKEIRESKDISLRTMAAKVSEVIGKDVSKDYIFRVENSQKSKITPDILEAFATALGVKLRDIQYNDLYFLNLKEDSEVQSMEVDKKVFYYLSDPENMKKVIEDANEYAYKSLEELMDKRIKL